MAPCRTTRGAPHYERIGLLDEPSRTGSGYREYNDDAASQLLFIARARRLGLGCDQIVALLPIWGGTDCGAAQDEVLRLIHDKQTEIAARIEELTTFAAELASVCTLLEASSPPDACRTDLTCCVPSGPDSFIPLEGLRASLH